MHRAIALSTGWLCAAAAATGVSWTAIEDIVGPGAGDSSAAVSPAARGDAPPLDVKALEGQEGVTVWPPRGTDPADGPTGTPAPTATGTAVSEDGGAGGAAGDRTATRRPRPAPTTPAPAGRGDVTADPAPAASTKGYPMRGGQVVLAVDPTEARLVSATPAAGYQTQTWNGPGFLRVDFVNGDQRSSLIASWAGTAPVVQIQEF